MKYLILGHNRPCYREKYLVHLSKKEFEEIKKARESLFHASEIEDDFRMLIENYAELEKELLNASVENTIFNEFDN